MRERAKRSLHAPPPLCEKRAERSRHVAALCEKRAKRSPHTAALCEKRAKRSPHTAALDPADGDVIASAAAPYRISTRVAQPSDDVAAVLVPERNAVFMRDADGTRELAIAEGVGGEDLNGAFAARGDTIAVAYRGIDRSFRLARVDTSGAVLADNAGELYFETSAEVAGLFFDAMDEADDDVVALSVGGSTLGVTRVAPDGKTFGTLTIETGDAAVYSPVNAKFAVYVDGAVYALHPLELDFSNTQTGLGLARLCPP